MKNGRVPHPAILAKIAIKMPSKSKGGLRRPRAKCDPDSGGLCVNRKLTIAHDDAKRPNEIIPNCPDLTYFRG